jgi:hypothetical protein
MALIPLITGYAPVQLKRGIDSMIPKKNIEWRPDKLILLMEARFNRNNKIHSSLTLKIVKVEFCIFFLMLTYLGKPQGLRR